MEFLQWLSQNWFNLLESASIVGSLLFAGMSLRDDVRARRIGNLMAITQHHREIWTYLYSRPQLSRVLDTRVNLKDVPVSDEEASFVNLLILHLNSAFHAMKNDVYIKPEGLRKDIQSFFSLPIPHAVWEKVKPLEDEEFVQLVESNRSSV